MEYQKPIKVASSHHVQRWISFYANLSYAGAPPPEWNYNIDWDGWATVEAFFNSQLHKKGVLGRYPSADTHANGSYETRSSQHSFYRCLLKCQSW